MTVAKAGKMLRQAGFTRVRQRNHAVWTHPDGRSVTLPLSGRDLYGNMAHKVRKYAEGGETSYQRQEGGRYEAHEPYRES